MEGDARAVADNAMTWSRSARWLAALVVLGTILAACGSFGEAWETAPVKDPGPYAALPGLLAAPAAPALIVTPGVDVANPFVLVDDGRYYVYSTQTQTESRLANVPVRVGPSMLELGLPKDTMVNLPPWARYGYTWAPDVRKVGDRYVMWFTAALYGGRSDAWNASQCIGVAVATSPTGPFLSDSGTPEVCQLNRWGSIDPRTFEDANGDLWLHWKSDDNAESKGTGKAGIFAQRLAEDGYTLLGDPTEIIRADQQWEGRIVEAPQMVLVDGRYWLFYSGNWFNQPIYGLGTAACAGPAGPCRKPNHRPWLGTNAQGAGPGEASLFQDDDGWWIVYAPAAIKFEEFIPRPIAMAPVAFGASGPYLTRRTARVVGGLGG